MGVGFDCFMIFRLLIFFVDEPNTWCENIFVRIYAKGGDEDEEVFIALMVFGLLLSIDAPAFCGEEETYDRDDGYGYQMMGPGYGMGPGWMMDNDHPGWGMHGWGRQSYRRHRGWESMKPEQREKMEKMWAAHLKDTLELRKQVTAKRMELRTLWAQPNVDRPKVEKLSNELAQLNAELSKKRDQYLVQCRMEFGDQGWACPGGM